MDNVENQGMTIEDIKAMFDAMADVSLQDHYKKPGDYWKNGVLYCGKCDAPRTYDMKTPEGFVIKHLPVVCNCSKREDLRENQLYLDRKRDFYSNTSLPYKDVQFSKSVFEKIGMQDLHNILIRFCENCVMAPDSKRKTYGLYFSGERGSGKTLSLCALADYLLLKNIPVKAMDIKDVLYLDDKSFSRVIYDLCRDYTVLFFDDFINASLKITEFSVDRLVKIFNMFKNNGTVVVLNCLSGLELMRRQKLFDHLYLCLKRSLNIYEIKMKGKIVDEADQSECLFE